MWTCRKWLILGIMVINDKEACLGKQRAVEKTKRRFPWRKLVGFNCRTEGIKQNIGKQRWKNLAFLCRYLQVRDNTVDFFFLVATNILAVSPIWGEIYSSKPLNLGFAVWLILTSGTYANVIQRLAEYSYSGLSCCCFWELLCYHVIRSIKPA